MAHRLVSRSGSNFVSFGAKETSATLEELSQVTRFDD